MRRELGRFAKVLAAAIHAKTGTPTLGQIGHVSTTIRYELKAQLALRWLRLNGDNLSMAEKLQLLDVITTASEMRDRYLAYAKLSDVQPGRVYRPTSPDWSELDNTEDE